ncbi:MAG: DUF2854 domain-containing protein [Cyanobacteria bacterium P01_F01_bin.150]
MLSQTSLGSVGLAAGLIVTIVGFVAYGVDSPTLNLIGFTFGFPILIGGIVLKLTELKPIPIEPPTPDAILALREQQATDTLNQIRDDVCRYRYGQEAHLAAALEFLGLSLIDKERPELSQLREENRDGAYTLILVFYSPLIPMATWLQRQPMMVTFFGPNVQVDVSEHPTYEKVVEVALMVTS